MQFKALAIAAIPSFATAAPSTAHESSSLELTPSIHTVIDKEFTPELHTTIDEGVVIDGPHPINTNLEQVEIEDIYKSPNPISAAEVFERAICWNGVVFKSRDLNALSFYLYNIWNMQDMPRNSVASLKWNTVKFCLYNKYIFVDTNVYFHSIGDYLLTILTTFCPSPYPEALCRGGIHQGRGIKRNLKIDIVAQNSRIEC